MIRTNLELQNKQTGTLSPKPGTDGALAMALINYIIKNDLTDKDYIDKYTDGFEELKNHVTDKTPEWAAKITGVNKEHIEKLAFELEHSTSCDKDWCCP